MPEVSVVLPVFNSEQTIARAVQSVLDQTLRDIELIVVDDGSTDRTVDIIEQIRDPRFKLVQCSHRSVAVAANRATELAIAPYIARMDADDFAYPQRLEKQLQWLLERNLDVVGCQVRILTDSNEAGPRTNLRATARDVSTRSRWSLDLTQSDQLWPYQYTNEAGPRTNLRATARDVTTRSRWSLDLTQNDQLWNDEFTHEPPRRMGRYERWINEDTNTGDRIMALRFVEFPIVNPTILARRSYFELGFRDNDLPEDYDLMLRAAAQGYRFDKVNEVLLDWIDRPDRLTRTDSRYSSDAFMRCRRLHFRAGPLTGVCAVDLWGIGKTGKPWLRWLQSEGISVRRGYDVNERKVNSRIHGVPVFHPSEIPNSEGTPLVIAVGAEDAREIILPQILQRGYTPGADAWFVA